MALLASRVSVPGSLMWFGEHAVLEGAAAVVGAIDRRMQLTLAPRKDGLFRIQSNLGHYEAPVAEPGEDERFRFLLEAVRRHAPAGGFDLTIVSEFSDVVGFGSSAAVTAGAVALLCGEMDRRRLFETSREVIRAVQGRGSGADVAASLYGGLVAFRADPVQIEPLVAETPPISVVYCGYKVPTPRVIEHLQTRRAEEPVLIEATLAKVGQIAVSAIESVQTGDWSMVGRLMHMHQRLADTLGINTPELQEIAEKLAVQPGMLGTKISGAGLGDCVLGLGVSRAVVQGFQGIPVATGARGLVWE